MNFKCTMYDEEMLKEIKKLNSYGQNLAFCEHYAAGKIETMYKFQEELRRMEEAFSKLPKQLPMYSKCYPKLFTAIRMYDFLEQGIKNSRVGIVNPQTVFLGFFFDFCICFTEEIRSIDKSLITQESEQSD